MGRIAATELMPDFSGRSVDHGRFRLLESLGSGAYGKVYRAIDSTSSSSSSSKPTVFAVKCLNKPAAGSHSELLQQREFAHHKLVAAHPNVVTFHQHFCDGLHVYVVLDLCTGGDLFAAITEKKLFHNNGRLIKHAFLQLIDAVDYCHKMGVFHRDIKPENVLCSEDGKDLRLADFGLSTQEARCSDFGCGSSYYMSPECIGREFSSTSYATAPNDVWALGVILTNMITGRNPWRYATSDDDCFSAFVADNNFLHQVLPISSGVNGILKKIFEVSPAKRIKLFDLRILTLELSTFYVDETRFEPGKATRDYDIASYQLPHGARFVRLDKAATSVFTSNTCNGSSTHSLLDQTESLTVPSFASSGTSSGQESKGPVTPITLAADDDLLKDIPEIPSEDGLGPPAELNVEGVVTKLKGASPFTKHRKPIDVFRSAVQRIKIKAVVAST